MSRHNSLVLSRVSSRYLEWNQETLAMPRTRFQTTIWTFIMVLCAAPAAWPTTFEVSKVADTITPYATFQSHNQKIVQNAYGIFMAYSYSQSPSPLGTWRLARDFGLQTDGDTNPAASPIRLFENGVGSAHSAHQDIRTLGGGRFSDWNAGAIYFSSSDNSDPRSNGRIYTWGATTTCPQ
jgi:hypothetical protein